MLVIECVNMKNPILMQLESPEPTNPLRGQVGSPPKAHFPGGSWRGYRTCKKVRPSKVYLECPLKLKSAKSERRRVLR